MSREITKIILHTAAHGTPEKNHDTSSSEINDWHVQRGWDGIGYHYVIRLNGVIERGRDELKQGAHCKGENENSIGICFSGNGDFHDITNMQRVSASHLILSLCRRYNLTDSAIFPHHVFNEHKTCPGKKVNWCRVKEDVKQLLGGANE